MAPRPSWHGYLKLSLVTCPVAMLPATSQADKVRFHTLNRATGHRVHARYVDAHLIAEHTQEWSPSLATDPVEEALRSMIEAQQKRARRSTKKPEGAKSGNVIDLMAVLKKSLQVGLPQRR